MLLIGAIMAILAGLLTAGATLLAGHGLVLALLSYAVVGSMVLVGCLIAVALLSPREDLHVA